MTQMARIGLSAACGRNALIAGDDVTTWFVWSHPCNPCDPWLLLIPHLFRSGSWLPKIRTGCKSGGQGRWLQKTDASAARRIRSGDAALRPVPDVLSKQIHPGPQRSID